MFEVVPDANKIQIRQAVEEIFGVRVTDVRTITVRGKMKRFRRGMGKKPNWKKAIVTLRDGDIIERRLEPWDMVYNPPGMIHGVRNDSDEDCYFQVMLGNPSPNRPQYEDPELVRLQRADAPDAEALQS